MRRELHFPTGPIDEPAWVRSRVPDASQGAVVTFSGVVRGTEQGAAIDGLDYSAFEAMARHQFGLLFDAMELRWPVGSVRLVHRLGPVPAGETSLWLEVTAPHRAEAFSAGQWLIDEMKRIVPIWKAVVPGSPPPRP